MPGHPAFIARNRYKAGVRSPTLFTPKGGVIFAQLWHVGRVSHTSLQPGGEAPVAPSAIRADNVKVFIETGPGTGTLADPSTPRALSTKEVKELVELYAQAARNALEAGF